MLLLKSFEKDYKNNEDFFFCMKFMNNPEKIIYEVGNKFVIDYMKLNTFEKLKWNWKLFTPYEIFFTILKIENISKDEIFEMENKIFSSFYSKSLSEIRKNFD